MFFVFLGRLFFFFVLLGRDLLFFVLLGRELLLFVLLSNFIKVTIDKRGYIIFVILFNLASAALFNILISLATSGNVVLDKVVVFWAKVI